MFERLREQFHRVAATDLDAQARDLQAQAIWHRHRANNLSMRLLARAALRRRAPSLLTDDDDTND